MNPRVSGPRPANRKWKDSTCSSAANSNDRVNSHTFSLREKRVMLTSGLCHVAAGRRPLVVCAYVCVCVGLFVSLLETCLRRSVGSLGSVCLSTTTTSRSIHNIADIIPTLGGAADATWCFFSFTLPTRSPPLSSLPLSAGQTAAFHLSLRRSVSQPICRSCDRPSPTPPAPFN